MILIQTTNANTPVNLVNGQPDLSSFNEPTKSILQAAFDNGSYIDIPDIPPQPLPPNPLGFRDKLYGLDDSSASNTLFNLVYVPNTQLATNPSTASAALTESRNILEGSLWNDPFSKNAFFNEFGTGSYNILKNFLTAPQITIFEANAKAFGLMN